MDNQGVSGPSWRQYQYGVDIVALPGQYSASRSEVVRRPNGHDLMHDREVITNYLNGPTPPGLTFDDELKMAVRRFRLKVDAHMAVEWEKARLRRAEAASKRCTRKMSQSRESGITFSQECSAMLAKVRKKIEIQRAVEKVKLNELMGKKGDGQYRDEAKLKDITAKMVEMKFAAPLADVYCFRAVLKELKDKTGGKVKDENRGNNKAIDCMDKQKRSIVNGTSKSIDMTMVKCTEKLDTAEARNSEEARSRDINACPDELYDQNNDKTENNEIRKPVVVDHEEEISRNTATKGYSDLQTDNGAGYQKVDYMFPHLNNPLVNVNENGQSMPKDEPRKQVPDVASHGRDYLSSDDIRAGGDGEVTKGPLNGHEDLGLAENEALDSDMDEEMKSGCWTFFSRMFRRLRKKKI